MTFVVSLTKPTIDIFDAVGADDFVFHSAYDTLKYEAQGTKTVTTNRADYYDSIFVPGWGTFYYYYTVGTIAHGLGYTPYFGGYLLNIPFTNTSCQAPFAFGDAGFFAYHAVYADDTYLYFVVHFNSTISPTGTVDVDFSYRIFKNDIEL